MPDLVVANREENRRHEVERLREAGIPVWVTEIETVDAALRPLRRLFTDVLSVPEPGWLQSASSQWSGSPALPQLRTRSVRPGGPIRPDTRPDSGSEAMHKTQSRFLHDRRVKMAR